MCTAATYKTKDFYFGRCSQKGGTKDVAANLFPLAHTFHKCLIIREFHKQLLLPRYSAAVKSASSSDNSIS